MFPAEAELSVACSRREIQYKEFLLVPHRLETLFLLRKDQNRKMPSLLGLINCRTDHVT